MFSLGQSSIFMLHIYPPANLGNEMEMLICLQFSIRSRHHQQTYQIIIKLFFLTKIVKYNCQSMSRPPTKGWEHEQSCKRKAAKNRGLVWRSNCCPNQFLYPLLLLSVRYHRRHETEKWICLQFRIGFCFNILSLPRAPRVSSVPCIQLQLQNLDKFLIYFLFNFTYNCIIGTSYMFYNFISFFHLGHRFAPSNVVAFFICAAYLLSMFNAIWVQCQR